MEFLFELLLDIFFEGSAELMGEKKVPFGLRIAIAALLILFCVGLFGLLLYIAFSTGSLLLILFVSAVTVALVTMLVIAVARQFKKSKGRNK